MFIWILNAIQHMERTTYFSLNTVSHSHQRKQTLLVFFLFPLIPYSALSELMLSGSSEVVI